MIAFVVSLILMSISWIITVGLVKLVTLCFGWAFSWLIATGIWLLFILIRMCIKN